MFVDCLTGNILVVSIQKAILQNYDRLARKSRMTEAVTRYSQNQNVFAVIFPQIKFELLHQF